MRIGYVRQGEQEVYDWINMNMATIAMVECSNVGGCWLAKDIDDSSETRLSSLKSQNSN